MKKNLSLLTLCWVLNLVSCAPSDEVDPCSQYDELDTRMLEIIDAVNSKNAGNKPFLEDFKMEQVYWIQYRDRRLRAMYPKSWDNFYRKEYGRETFNSCKCQEMVRLAEIRIDDLKMYLEGGPTDQSDCPSMFNNP